MQHVIHTYGGGEIFHYVFQGISALLGGGGFLNNMIRMAAIVGAFWALLLMVIKNSLDIGIRWFFWFLIITNVFFLPKTTVWIDDPLVHKKYKIDNVPLALGLFAGTASRIGHVMTEKVEQLFTLPDYMPYHKTGTVFASKIMAQASQFKILDADFNANMERFVTQCVVYDAMIGYKYTLKDLQASTDIWGLVKNQASPVLGFLYKEPGGKGEVVTCRVGAGKLDKVWQQQVDLVARSYGARFYPRDPTHAKREFLSHLPQSYQLLTDISQDAQKILQQEMMINAITDASNNKLSELGGSSNYAATKALLQQRTTYQISGEMAGKILPIMKNVFEALAYAAFIFIFILALLPDGYRVLGSYIGLLLWIQMWAPLYAILNLFMTLSGKYSSTGAVGGEGITMMTSVGLANVNADTEALAGWLSMSIPAISYVIVKGGASAFVNLAGHLGSAMQSAASSVAHEVTSGNLSLGNVSQGVLSYQNTSGFQSNMSLSHRDGQFEQNLDDGTIKATQVDGSQIFRGGAGNNTSQLRVKPHTSTNWSDLAQEQVSHATSVVQAQSQELASAKSTAARQVVSLAMAMSKGQNSTEGYDHSTAVGKNKAVSNVAQFNETIQDQYGLNSRQSAEISAAVVVGQGTPQLIKSFGGFELRGEASGRAISGAERAAAFQDIHSLAKNMQVSNSLDKTVRSVKDLKFGSSQSEEARLVDDISSSGERMTSARHSISKAQQVADNYTKFYSMSKSGAFNIDRDESQELLEFTADQKDNGRKIGMDGAYRLLNTGGYQASACAAAFRESKWQSISSQIENSSTVHSEQDIMGIYENATTYSGNRSAFVPINETAGIRSGGTSRGLIPGGIVNTAAKDIYQQSAQAIGEKIRAGGDQVNHEGKQIKQSVSRELRKSAAEEALGNALESVPGVIKDSFRGAKGGGSKNLRRPKK